MNDEETRVTPSPPAPPTAGSETEPELRPPPAETLAHPPEELARAAALSVPGLRAVRVPGYDILGELGRGGMGVVYKARQIKLNRVVALKMVLAGGHAGAADIARFVAEAEAVAAVRHLHVIQVFDSGEADGHPYMAMEFLEGSSMVQKLRECGKLPPRDAAELMLKIARGVQAAHDRGIVHRDLKPHNVMLDLPHKGAPAGAWGEPKVMDFGLAKRDGAELTQTGAVMGTPAYMSPEQARGETKAIGRPADVYALGVMLYECLCGSVPFRGSDAWSVIRQVVEAEPEPLGRRLPGVPHELDLICRKCLEKNPADRYSSAGALADDLRRYLDGEALLGPQTGIWFAARRKARKWWRPVAAVAALMVLIIAAWLLPSPLDLFRPKGEDPVVAARRAKITAEVAAMRLERPLFDRAPVHAPRVIKDDLPKPDYSAFKVFEDHRVVDLRRWRQLPANDPTAESIVVYTTQRKMMKVAEAAELRAETRTSGRDVINRAQSPDVKAYEHAADKLGYVGQQPMKIRQLVFDMSRQPLHQRFDLKYTSTYLDSIQTPDEQWFGVIGYEGSVMTSMLMLFPDGKPFREYELKYAPTLGSDPSKRADPMPYTGPVITFAADDKSWLYWEIPTPQAGHVYRVDWAW
jgi:tRNA A-37 threonylcarbamoyl transferase component Bud32